MGKKVNFSMDTKNYDGSSKELNVFRIMVISFLTNKIITPFCILKVLKNEKDKMEILNFIIAEINILMGKLEELVSQEIFLNLFEVNTVKKQKGVPLIRQGCRISKEKLTANHIPYIAKLYAFLFEAKDYLKVYEKNK